MAKFKLYLINLNTVKPDHEPTYFKQVISEFYDQQTEYLSSNSSPVYSYCYTSNEKFTETTNSQKKLSFSMNRKIIRDDRIEDNPFVYNIAIGTQLLLEDKHGKHHLMTVSDIQFDFKELNLVYNYQCQDSFTWQLSRQNDGYEIINDISSSDFLGVKNIDDWTRKICNECNVVYRYKGFIDDNTNPLSTIKDFIKTIPFSGSGTANSLLISLGEQYGLQIRVYEHFNDNNTITKEFYYVPLKSLEVSGLKYSPYYNIQSFGLTHNGTSLSSVLNVQSNSINDEIVTLIPPVPAFFRSWFRTAEWYNSKFTSGMFNNKCNSDSKYMSYSNQIAYISTSGGSVGSILKNNSSKLDSSFWTTKPDFSTIKYGGNDINDLFNNTTADDFTSITDVNVEYDKKTYSYLKIQWKSVGSVALDYTPKKVWFGIDNDMEMLELKEDMYFIVKNLEDPEEDLIMRKRLSYILSPKSTSIYHQEFLYVPLNRMLLNSNYPFVSFQSKEHQSYLHTKEGRNNDIIFNYHYNTDTIWSLVQLNNTLTQEVRANLDQIPESWFNASYEYFIKIPLSSLTSLEILDLEIYLNFYRNPTEEEIEFANIADQCPWLENKLFNFDYFYNHQIINRRQYSDLQQFIQNDLRKSSARLLLYTQLYYQALKDKTINLANLESQVDRLGAVFNGEFIAPVNERKSFESSDFITAYTSLFVGQAENKIPLVDYAKTMTDYINKYISSEQTFLKNMYLFKNYFNAKLEHNQLYEYQVEIDNSSNSSETISFSKPDQYKLVGDDFSFYDSDLLPTTTIYKKEDKIYHAIPRDSLIGLNNLHDKNLYYIDSTEAKHRIWTTYSEDTEYDTSSNYIITEHEFNPDTKYLEEQWVYSLDSSWTVPLSNGPVLDEVVGMYELYRVDIWNKKAYVRSYQHCIQNKPTESLSFKLDTNHTLTCENPTSIYETVSIFEMKCNYFYRCKLGKITPDSSINYYRKDVESVKLSTLESWDTLFPSDSSIKQNFPNSKNYSDDDSLDVLYNANFPLTTVQYHYTEDDKEKIENVDFINYNNAANFYRRISVSNGWKIGWSILGGSMAGYIWRNGHTSWGTEGWTYQDVWGNPLESNQFNSSWTDSESMIYTKSNTAWLEIFKSEKVNESEVWSNWDVNKAKNILYTLPSFKYKSSKDYYYTPYYWRVLTDGDYINPSESYKILYYKNDKPFINEKALSGDLDAIVNYPLGFVLVDLMTSEYDFSSNPKKTTVRDFLSGTGVLKVQQEYDAYAVIHEEHYTKERLNNILSSDTANDLSLKRWYDADHFAVDFSTIPHITDGFFINKNNENYQPVSNLQITTQQELSEHLYYRFQENQYIPCLTLHQQLSNGNVYTKLGDTYTYKTFELLSHINLPVNVYTKTNNVWVFKESRVQSFKVTPEKNSNSSSWSNMTNGLFWAKYRNDVDNSVLMQEAMLIETNLTEYWTNAYYASKNCKYFLPEHWQPVINSQINYFSNDILITKVNSTTNELASVILNNKYIPDVSCVSGQPYYTYTYTDHPEIVDGNSEKVYNQQVSLSSIYSTQPWLQDTIKYLGINDALCMATILNYHATYYTRQSGGQTWYDTLNMIGQNQFISFDKFGGWCDMIIKTLNSKYYSYTVTEYENALLQHQANWKYLYQTYPNLIYEKSFEYPDATTSKELLDAATFAFRQYTDVERQYNIQTIDLAGLKGYQGQHLQIGDAIELDADELYEAYDDIKTSLLQYLYVSDISYDLRNDANIQLTVNNIKYSDKVIGELVKLIR